MVYNIIDYGAIGNGETVNTNAIQSAINDCAETGGQVLIPAGIFVTGSIELKSNIDLHLEKGAVLRASKNLADYNTHDAYDQNWGCPNEGWDSKHLIWCAEQENVSISGSGTIDGIGKYFFGEKFQISKSYAWRWGAAKQKPCFEARPGQLIVFSECKNIKIADVNIIDATCWAVYFHGSQWVQVRGITIKNENFHLNTDGIDIDACKYVTVSDCIIDTGDDAITFRCSGLKCLKNNDGICEHITVTNCVLSSASSCFRIGVGTGIIRHVKVSNITIKSSSTAIHFNPEWAENSTPTYDVSFNNITAVNTGIFFCLSSTKTPMSYINISNAYSECDSSFLFRNASEDFVKNITFSNILIKQYPIDVEERWPFTQSASVGNLVIDNVRCDEGEISL